MALRCYLANPHKLVDHMYESMALVPPEQDNPRIFLSLDRGALNGELEIAPTLPKLA
jgi:hypothetical protein